MRSMTCSFSLAVLCLVLAGSAPADATLVASQDRMTQELDQAPATPQTPGGIKAPPAKAGARLPAKEEAAGFSVALLLAPGKPGSPVEGLSADEMKAVQDASALLPYKSFQRLDSVFVRGPQGGLVRLQGPAGREYSAKVAAGSTYYDGVWYLNVAIDVTDSSSAGSVLKSEFRINLGETVIVGTSRVNGSDQALVLLLTAVPAVRVYKADHAGVVLPTLVAQIKPQYTAAAMRARIEGSVTLECVVGTDGSVGDVRVVKFLEPELDQEAINAARQWRFKPGTKDGKPVPVQVSIELWFSLRK